MPKEKINAVINKEGGTEKTEVTSLNMESFYQENLNKINQLRQRFPELPKSLLRKEFGIKTKDAEILREIILKKESNNEERLNKEEKNKEKEKGQIEKLKEEIETISEDKNENPTKEGEVKNEWDNPEKIYTDLMTQKKSLEEDLKKLGFFSILEKIKLRKKIKQIQEKMNTLLTKYSKELVEHIIATKNTEVVEGEDETTENNSLEKEELPEKKDGEDSSAEEELLKEDDDQKEIVTNEDTPVVEKENSDTEKSEETEKKPTKKINWNKLNPFSWFKGNKKEVEEKVDTIWEEEESETKKDVLDEEGEEKEKTLDENSDEEKVEELGDETKEDLSKEEESEKEEPTSLELQMKFSGLNDDDFKNIPEWQILNENQKILVVEQIAQNTLSTLRELGEKKFAEKNKINFSLNPSSWRPSLIGKIWHNMTKSYWISKEEKNVLKDFRRGEIKPDEKAVELLTKRMADLDLDIYSDKIEVTRINFLNINNATEEERELVNNYNKIATRFSDLPDSWKNKNGVKKNEHKKYLDRQEIYSELRNDILELKAKKYEESGMSKEMAMGKAMMDVKEADRKIAMLQFTNTNPSVYEELEKIQNEKSWKRLLNNENLWRGFYMTTGFVSRKVLTYGIGFIAAPLVAGTIGGIRSRQEAKNKIELALANGGKELTRRERKELGLSGIMDNKNADKNIISKILSVQEINAKEVGAFVDADSQIQRLEKLINEFSEARSIEEIISMSHKLQTRLAYIESKQKEGLLNFGNKNAIGLNYDLLMTMSKADVELSRYQGLTTGRLSADSELVDSFVKEEMKRRETLLDEIREKNSIVFGKKIAEIKKYEMLRGASVGATFSALAWKITDIAHGGHGELFSGGKLKSFFADFLRRDPNAILELGTDAGPININADDILRKDLDKITELQTDAIGQNINSPVGIDSQEIELTPEQIEYIDSFFTESNENAPDLISEQKVDQSGDLAKEQTQEGVKIDEVEKVEEKLKNAEEVSGSKEVNDAGEGSEKENAGDETKEDDSEKSEKSKEEKISTVEEKIKVKVKKGEGVISTLKNLQKELGAKYPEIDQAPENIKHILETDAHDLAKEYGMYNPGQQAESALIKEGAYFEIDKEGQVVFYEKEGGDALILKEGTKYEGKMIDTTKDTVSESYKDSDLYKNNPQASIENPEGDVPAEGSSQASVAENSSSEDYGPYKESQLYKDNPQVRLENPSQGDGRNIIIDGEELTQNNELSENITLDSFSPEILAQANEINIQNVEKIFPDNNIKLWDKLLATDISADKFIDLSEKGELSSDYKLAGEYFERIKNISGVNPYEKNIIQDAEGIEDYAKRAISSIIKNNKLDEIKL